MEAPPIQPGQPSFNSTGQGPATPPKPIPFLDRWDIYPLLGTAIAPFRMIYGLFQVTIGLGALPFKGPEILGRGAVQIKRSCISFFSFVPAARRKLEEMNKGPSTPTPPSADPKSPPSTPPPELEKIQAEEEGVEEMDLFYLKTGKKCHPTGAGGNGTASSDGENNGPAVVAGQPVDGTYIPF